MNECKAGAPHVAVVADDWKLKVLKRRLKKGGYSFDALPFTKDTTVLKVVYDGTTKDSLKIQKIVQEATQECRASKLH